MTDDEPPSEPEFVVITASNPSQAAMYRQLVQARVDAGLYPARVAFRFYSDPPGGRVGSGGGTLLALLALLRDEDGSSTAPLAQRAAASWLVNLRRLRANLAYFEWIGQPYAPPPRWLFADDAAFEYAPTGTWSSPPVIHEYRPFHVKKNEPPRGGFFGRRAGPAYRRAARFYFTTENCVE